MNVNDSTAALGLNRVALAELLARWHEKAWLRGVRRGFYAAVPERPETADAAPRGNYGSPRLGVGRREGVSG